VCQTDVVSLPHGQAPGVSAGGRLSGRWRYDRTAGRGIALSYDRSASAVLVATRPNVYACGRLSGRWRYNGVAERGIALSYDRVLIEPPAAPPPRPEPVSPPVSNSTLVRVLCYCGEDFTFEGDAGICPRCGEQAEWPTMGVVEREMRSDLSELLRAHEQGSDPD